MGGARTPGRGSWPVVRPWPWRIRRLGLKKHAICKRKLATSETERLWKVTNIITDTYCWSIFPDGPRHITTTTTTYSCTRFTYPGITCQYVFSIQCRLGRVMWLSRHTFLHWMNADQFEWHWRTTQPLSIVVALQCYVCWLLQVTPSSQPI